MSSDRIVVAGGKLHFRGASYPCAVGKSGVTADKKEGDGRTPAGTFALRECWYRPDRIKPPKTGLPLHMITGEDGWCDDPAHVKYNRPVRLPFKGNHEKLCRADAIYDVLIPLGYNDDPVVAGKGSAIFLHVAKPDYSGTEGCVALALKDLLAILPHLAITTQIQISR